MNQRYAFLCGEPLDPRLGYGTASYAFGLMAALSARGRKIGLVEPSAGPLGAHIRRWWFNRHLPRHVDELDVDCFVGIGFDGYRYAMRSDRRPYALLVDRLRAQDAEYTAGKDRRLSLRESRWQKTAIGAADLVLAPSAALSAQIVTRFGLPSSRVHALNPGIDTEAWPPQPPKNEGPPTVLTAGRLTHRKGIDQLVDIWPTVLRSIPEARLMIVGDGPQRALLVRQITQRNLSDHIQIRPAVPQSQIRHHLAGCDLVCITARHADFSMSALEAMASARAIVAACSEAVTECVGEAAHLVAADQPDALAQGIVHVLSSGELRQRLAQAGVARAQSLKWESAALRMGALLAEI